ncbi:DNA repair endonuclease XPF [Portunus trituberculatus]|uniref:DNA repair endonuclease XPF n=1 Tax=Portunus trituberculatus TaxID=210409 RepID=A0A5B7IRC1_PORTR|nr:DNA repair endonuclease XPF [Portunus trituberculatus]
MRLETSRIPKHAWYHCTTAFLKLDLTAALYILLVPSTNNDPFKMTRLLEEVQPKYIIMYDSDLSFIRQLEVKEILK